MKKVHTFKQTEIGEIPDDWDIEKLVKLTKKIGSGITPRGGSSVYQDDGIALIRSQNVYNNKFSHNGLAHINDVIAQSMKNVEVQSLDILLNITGDSVARACIVPENVLPARVNQHVSIIRTNQKLLNSIFLKYYLVSPGMQSEMLSLAGAGATRKALTKGMIDAFLVPVPEIREQYIIASILSSLDNKIELNRKMNKTLEEIGKALFKRWFVDFEFPNENSVPYRSNDGEMVESELGEIPKGWKAGTIKDIATVKSGFAFKSSAFSNNGDYGVIKIKNILDPDVDVSDLEYVPIKELSDRARQYILQSGDILIAMSGNTTGKIGILVKNQSELVLNQRAGKYFLKDEIHHWYLYFMLKSGDVQKAIVEKAYGSAQPNISPNILESVAILLPGNNILKRFEELSKLLMEKYISNQGDVNILSNLRDLLLPRLMSGKIRAI